MDDKEQLFEKIESYLRGKLPEAEAHAFEQEVENDPQLAEEVEKHRAEQEGLEFLLEEQLRAKMKEWKAEGPGPEKAAKSLWWLWALLAAVVLILFLLLSPGQEEPDVIEPPAPPAEEAPAEEPSYEGPVAEEKNTPERPPEKVSPPPPPNEYLAMAETAYQLPEHLGGTLKSAAEEAQKQTVLDPGIRAFSMGNYPLAIEELRKVGPDDGPQAYELAREWLAHAYFKQQEFARAAEIFQSIVNANHPPFIHDRAEWYLLLSLLPDYSSNKNRVDALIDKMVEPDNYHSYAESAQALKDELGN